MAGRDSRELWSGWSHISISLCFTNFPNTQHNGGSATEYSGRRKVERLIGRLQHRWSVDSHTTTNRYDRSSILNVPDFADFATAAPPQAASHVASSASAFTDAAAAAATSQVSTPGSFFNINPGTMAGRPYTKWYRVWERVTIRDFYQELFIIPLLAIIILINLWGANANRSRAKEWARAHLPLLSAEFAAIGFGRSRRQPSIDDKELYKEKSKSEFVTYCTGRQNVASLDIKLSLYKRYNPVLWYGESALSFFFDSFAAPVERFEATATCFDGKEKSLVPAQAQGQGQPLGGNSAYDGFVWAIVHKDKMRQLREDRYDVSLTSTKDHPKLPAWVTVMSESSEITDALLTPELIQAVTEAGEDLEALVISDQPEDAPRKYVAHQFQCFCTFP